MIVAETERLSIRWLVADDAEFINRLYNTDGFLQFIGDRGIRSIADSRQFLLDGPLAMYRDLGVGLYLVQRKSDQTSLGICGLLKRDSLDDIDIGYAFLPEFGGVGYAIESARAVLEYGRSELDLERLVAITSSDNAASIDVLIKLGMTFEKNIKDETYDTPTRLYRITFDPEQAQLLDQDRILKRQLKVCPVMTRQTFQKSINKKALKTEALKTEVLVFKHPEAGIQFIKGTIEAGESAMFAASRELAEESGIKTVKAKRYLACWESGYAAQQWHFVLCETESLPDQWTFFTEDDGGHEFEFFWHCLESAPTSNWHQVYQLALKRLRKLL